MPTSIPRWAAPIFALLLLSALSPCAAADDTNCDLKAPLANALVAQHEGAYFFVYPPVTVPHYNGCQIMWIEKQIAVIARFKDGSLIEFDALKEDGSLEQTCFYTNYKLSGGSVETCPAPEDFANSGLEDTIGGNQGIRVPPDRDIRVKPRPCAGSEKACAK